MMKKITLFFVGIFSLLFLFSVNTIFAAGNFQDGVIGEEQIVPDDLLLHATKIEVNGTINGIFFAIGQEIKISSSAVLEDDVFLIAQSVTIEDGAILKGNLTLLARSVEVDSTINRNIYAGAVTFKLNPKSFVGNNVLFAGFQFTTTPESIVDKNVYLATYQSQLSGKIQQNLRIATASLELNGEVSADAMILLNLWQINDDSIRFWMPYLKNFGFPDPLVGGLSISDKAKIGGKLEYSSNDVLEEALDINPPGGIIIRTPNSEQQNALTQNQPSQIGTNLQINRFLRMMRLFVSLVFCGLFTIWISPGLLNTTSRQIHDRPLNAFGIGLISSITVYIGLFVLLIFFILFAVIFGLFSLGSLGSTIFGLGIVSIGWVFLFFSFLVKYISKIVVSFWIGKVIFQILKKEDVKNNYVILCLGVIVFVLVNAIPLIGWLISIAVTLIGIGAMWYVLQSQNKYPFLKWKS